MCLLNIHKASPEHGHAKKRVLLANIVGKWDKSWLRAQDGMNERIEMQGLSDRFPPAETLFASGDRR